MLLRSKMMDFGNGICEKEWDIGMKTWWRREKNNVLIVTALTISPGRLPKQQPQGEKTLRTPDLLSFLVKYLSKEFDGLPFLQLRVIEYSLKLF